jgi:hypothetical protein
MGILFTLLNLSIWGIVWVHFSRTKVATGQSISVPPWSVSFNSQHAIQLIASDPNEAEIEWLTGQQVSVTDYANRNYIPQPNHLSPDMIRICQIVLRGGQGIGNRRTDHCECRRPSPGKFSKDRRARFSVTS